MCSAKNKVQKQFIPLAVNDGWVDEHDVAFVVCALFRAKNVN
jgi:hypothetical protein